MDESTKTTIQRIIKNIVIIIVIVNLGTFFIQTFLVWKIWNIAAAHFDFFSIKYITSVIVCITLNIIINTIRRKIKNNQKTLDK